MSEIIGKPWKAIKYAFNIFVPIENWKNQCPGGSYSHRYAPDERVNFAKSIIERYALVAGDDGGEDTAGRFKPRRQTPEEIVTFACDTAQRAYDEFEKRGWLQELPSLEEIEDMARENSDRN